MRKRVLILGSTGSIGRSALEVLDALSCEWEVVGLGAGSRLSDLATQARRFRPRFLSILRGDRASLRGELDYDAKIFAGPDALAQLVQETDFDCAICGVVGAAGLPATLKAVEKGGRIALANKEALVVAGSLMMPMAKRSGAEIIPVDSEHSAIFQALQAGRRSEVGKVYLTASGGPFRTWSREAMEEVTLEDALRHPTWDMGPKITIDSATMMNKAMEIVEARWLFNLAPGQIEVVIHPESVVHSMVEFCDGSVVAQLGTPDMRTPIQYALTYPGRSVCPSKALDIVGMRQLTFHAPDVDRFPALRLGYEVASRGGTSGAVLNAANEAAVELFREGNLSFSDIAALTEKALKEHAFVAAPSLDELFEADRWARQEVARCTAC